MCDSIFFSEDNSNCISFEKVAEIVNIPLDDVEPLIIHVLSIGMLEGRIDENNSQFIIHSIKPRELDDERLVQLQGKFEAWQNKISSSLDFIRNC